MIAKDDCQGVCDKRSCGGTEHGGSRPTAAGETFFKITVGLSD